MEMGPMPFNFCFPFYFFYYNLKYLNQNTFLERVYDKIYCFYYASLVNKTIIVGSLENDLYLTFTNVNISNLQGVQNY